MKCLPIITILFTAGGVLLLQNLAESTFVTERECNFELDYCSWTHQALSAEGQGSSGITQANHVVSTLQPRVDFDPGNENGSYFYYMRPVNYYNQVPLLSYPSQKFVTSMNFAFFMTGPQALRIAQVNGKIFDISSNYTWNGNQSAHWEQASVQFGPPHPTYGIIIESPSLSGEIGEAPLEGDPFLAIDNITLTFTLPCDFSALSVPGNLVISHPSFLDINLGHVNTVQFSASSLICPEGPFIYTLESNNVTGLSSIFHLNSSTGLLTVNATGPHLIGKGVSLGLITVSAYVQDSNFMQPADNPFKKVTALHFQQDPTIMVSSSHSVIAVTVGSVFSHTVNASSVLNASLQFSITQTNPPSLAGNINISGNTLQGVLTYQNLVDIVQNEITSPKITVSISDSYGEVRNHTVQLSLPSQVPPVFTEQQYTFHVTENTDPISHPLVGDILVGTLTAINCNAITAQITTNNSNVTGTFSLLPLPLITLRPNFCTYRLITTVALNYEDRSQYHFNITAQHGLSSVAMVTVQVDGVNEYKPTISPKMFTAPVSDYTPVNMLVLTLMASDEDGGPDGQLSYSISEGNTEYFKLRQVTNNEVQIEIKHSPIEPNNYLIEVTVADNGNPSKSDTAVITVSVIASTQIQCNQSLFGPPVITGVTPPLQPAAGSNVTLQCNFTANPGHYPLHWYKSPLNSPLDRELITSDSGHYDITGNTLTVHSVTSNDVKTYTCNVTNQCGSTTASIFLALVIQHPAAPSDLSIIQGPTQRSVLLSWTPPLLTIVSPITGYSVQLSQEGGAYFTYQELDYYTLSNVAVSDATVLQLYPGTNYTARVLTVNKYFESSSNIVKFSTLTSAPKLAFLNVTVLLNNALSVEWRLEYTGGSHDVHMTITVESNELQRRRKRRSVPVTMSFPVGINDNVLVTPTLPFGQSYQIVGAIESEYGAREHTATAFVGVEDTLYCPFSLDSTCHWILEEGILTLASSAVSPKPTTDASGDSAGVYVLGTASNELETLPLLSFPSLGYICGLSFYYQVYGSIRLRLESSGRGNESLFWASSIGETTDSWTLVELPLGDFPFTLSTDSLLITMETIAPSPAPLSFAAVDDVSLHFCLPCNYSNLTSDSIKLSYMNHSTFYIRQKQSFAIETAITGCGNPILQYSVQTVVPNQLASRVLIPNQRVGVIEISDITADIVEPGTTGYIIVQVDIVAADYRNDGRTLSQKAIIGFIVSEKFENCSYSKSCDFEHGSCDWQLSDQSNTSIAQMTGNSVLYSRPQTAESAGTRIIGHQIINDSYCGLSFVLLNQGIDLRVLVSGIGVVWSSWSLLSPHTHAANDSGWRNASVYIDVGNVEMMSGRSLALEMVVSSDTNFHNSFIALDNVTLHPCIDCQAQECSCISCIQQCSTVPCQEGHYLSLEVNQCRLCPNGHYCDNWRSLPKPCPLGTFNNRTGAAQVDNCQVCPNGSFAVSVGSSACQTCPTGYNCSNPAALPIGAASGCDQTPVSSQSMSLFIAAVIGGCLGAILTCLLLTLISCWYCYRNKRKVNTKRKKERQMYADNFFVSPESKSKSGYKSATVRTASTILSMMGKETEAGNRSYRNPVYDSDSSSDDDSKQMTRDPTIASLNSLDVKVDWPDTNPFAIINTNSETNMSDLIELDGQDDHVWPALQRKKKQSDSKI